MNVIATEVRIEPQSGQLIDVYIDGVADSEYLGEIDAQAAVDHYGIDTLLDLIGRDEVISHFEIEEKE